MFPRGVARERRRSRRWLTSSLAAAGVLVASVCVAQPPNPLTNASFEDDVVAPAGAPDGWTLSAWIPSLVSTTLDSSVRHEGSRSLRVNLPSSSMPNSASWEQTVTLAANTNYLLTGWIRTENVQPTLDPFGEFGAHLAIGGSTSAPIIGTHDWTYVRVSFSSGSSGSVTVAAGLGLPYGRTRGTAWFDDLRITPIAATDPHPSWKILVLIYQRTDFTYTDGTGTHHLVGQMTAGEVSTAAAAATRFVHNDIPQLTSGHMVPRLTIRYPGTVTKLSFFAGGGRQNGPTRRRIWIRRSTASS